MLFAGLSRGSSGGGRSSSGGRSSGRSYSGGGGGYSSGGSSDAGYPGSLFAIYGGVVGGCIALSVLICGCCMICKHVSDTGSTEGVIVNAPNRTRLSPKFYQNQTGTNIELNDLPPAYSKINKPILDVQNEIKRTQLNRNPPSYKQNTAIRPQATGSVVKVHKHSPRKTN